MKVSMQLYILVILTHTIYSVGPSTILDVALYKQIPTPLKLPHDFSCASKFIDWGVVAL
jgi:hypothetical protein